MGQATVNFVVDVVAVVVEKGRARGRVRGGH